MPLQLEDKPPPSRIACFGEAAASWWRCLGKHRLHLLGVFFAVFFSRLCIRASAMAGRIVVYSSRDAVSETLAVIMEEVVNIFGSIWGCVKTFEDYIIMSLEVTMFGSTYDSKYRGRQGHFQQPEGHQREHTPTAAAIPQHEYHQPPPPYVNPSHPTSPWTPFWAGVQTTVTGGFLLRRYGEWWWSLLAIKLGLAQ